MNILRCWGGVIIDKEPFFEACDELGIMIWQEFPLACNNYSGSEKYLRVLEQEARAIVKRVRRHACHVLWCGGNELFKAVFDEKTLHTPDSSEDSPWVIHSGFRAWGLSTWCCFDTIKMFFSKQKTGTGKPIPVYKANS